MAGELTNGKPQKNKDVVDHIASKSANKKNEPNDKTRFSTDKVFVARESLLTELLETPHTQSVYNIFIVILIVLFLNTVIYDLVDRGRINLGFRMIRAGFGKIGTMLYIWTYMQAAAFLPHPSLKLWATCRRSLVRAGRSVQIWDIAWLCILTVFQVTFVVLSISAVLKYSFPPASKFALLVEMVRFVMKIHAYVRSVSPRALHHPSPHSSVQPPTPIPLSTFPCYLYFMFAPTLIYRDSYPRTGHIRWRFVAARMAEIAAIIFCYSFMFERFILINVPNFGKSDEVVEAKQLVALLFGAMFPCLLVYFCGFYLVLHSWLNAAAEVLTFADRQFYLDWWNESSNANFYRKWNVVVHDWFHAYVYKDILILTGSRVCGTLLVFSVSAIFHEIIISFTLGFFYPILLVLFGFFGMLLVLLTKQSNSLIGNIFMWLSLAVGNGFIGYLYSMEYYARKTCPAKNTGIWEILIPRWWSCLQIVLRPDWKLQNSLFE